MDGFYFLRVDGLVLYQVVDFLHPGRICGQELVGDVDVALAFPQGEAGVGYMPCPDYEVVWWGGIGSIAGIDFWESDRDRRHVCLSVGWACEDVEGVKAFDSGRAPIATRRRIIVNLHNPNW